MEWKKLSTASTVLASIAVIIIFCGSAPLLLIHRHDSDTENLSELSKLVLDLEKKQIELDGLISNFRRDDAKHLAASNSVTLERLSILSTLAPKSTALSVNFEERPEEGTVGVAENEKLSAIADEISVNFSDPANHPGVPVPHFPQPITFNTPTSHTASSVLVVGGTGKT